MTYTAQQAQRDLANVLTTEYAEKYNYDAVVAEMDDSAVNYGICEIEIPASHTLLGRPFVLRA